MFYSLLFLTALLSQLHQGSSASSQNRVTVGATTRPSIDALNNLVVIGDRAGSTNVGDVSFSFYSYSVSTSNVLSADDYAQAAGASNGGSTTNTKQTAAATDLAGNTFLGLGHDVAIADMNTVFVSQTSTAKQTGRVVLYEGNVTTFSQKQLLIPYDGKHRMDSEAAFGESIAATHDTLAVGCQNCNSSAPIFSGAVYVYKPNANNRWSESQILTANGVLFLGEHVAAHNKVLVAAGDDSSGVALASQHNYANRANTVVIYEQGPDGKYSQSQVITVKAGSTREMISGVSVFDETIAITTMGTDTDPAVASSADKVYIYYPMNKRYGFSNAKPKPHPQQWTNTQILSSAPADGDYRYLAGSPDTSISMNTLKYLTVSEEGASDLVGIATSTRECLSCKFNTPTVVATSGSIALTDKRVGLASDSSAFYTFSDVVADRIADPTLNYVSTGKRCLTLALQDQFNDGWGVASLVVTSPSGARDKFTLQCTTANPNVFSYCPDSMEEGIYNLHIENGKETPFGWEIIWKVATGTSWYVGDRDTHMFFNWNEKYEDFQIHDSKNLLPQYATCEICDPNKPTGKHHRSLSNLRSLGHKGTTSSPTISAAPTITANGYTGAVWNQFVFVAGSPWFDDAYQGSAFFVSDKEGKHLIKTGTTCASGATQKCWVELPDGDYIVRVGDSTNGGAGSETYAFCESSNALGINTELHFTVLDQQCYAGSYYELANLCRNTYKSAFFLNVDVLLNGAVDLLSVSDESALRIAVSETMLSVLGSMPSSITISKQSVQNAGVQASLLLEFSSLPDTTALDNFVSETSSASSLLKYELLGSQEMASKFLKGEVSSVTIVSASTDVESRDYTNVDESSFQAVSDHVWKTNEVEPASNNFNIYAKYVSEGAYAVVGVAAVLAVSLFIKRSVGNKAVTEENV